MRRWLRFYNDRRPGGSTWFNPGASEIIRPNDTLITIGPTGAVARLEQMGIAQARPAT